MFKLTIRVRAPSSPVLGIMYVRGVCYHVFVYSTRESTLLLRVRLLNKRDGVVSYVCSPHTRYNDSPEHSLIEYVVSVYYHVFVYQTSKSWALSRADLSITREHSSIACLLTGRTGALIDRLQAPPYVMSGCDVPEV